MLSPEENVYPENSTTARPSSLRALAAWYFVLSFTNYPDALSDAENERKNFEHRMRQLLWWPPDIFALTSTALNRTGAYKYAVGPRGRFGRHLWQRLDWQMRVEGLAEAWRSSISQLILKPLKLTEEENEEKDEFLKKLSKPDDEKKRKEDRQKKSRRIADYLKHFKQKKADERLRIKIEELSEKRCSRRFLEKIDFLKIDKDSSIKKSHNLIEFFIGDLINLSDEDGFFSDQNLLAVSVKADRHGRPGAGESESKAARFFEAIIGLHILADAASYSIGVPRSSSRESVVFDALANLTVTLRGSLSTVSKFHGVVLPKIRTPQTGLTLRNLSHNLTFHDSEVEVMWRSFPWSNFDENTFNVLYVPYPFDFDPQRFKIETNTYESTGFFSYNPGEWNEIGSVVTLIENIRKGGTQPHMLVFTETAFNEDTYKRLLTALSQRYGSDDPRRMPVVLAGVASKDGELSYNELRLSTFFAGKWYQLKQQKHHRWQLNRDQIRQYNLQGHLSTARPLFENSEVDQRRLTFFAPTPWLVLSPLICEDLARIEPVSEIIRGVGPTLVFALLLDGPQLEGRWPGRYASILADDPGTGVLTMTSFGAARVSKSAAMLDASDGQIASDSDDKPVMVASWKGSTSSFKALSVAKNQALLLTLTAHLGEEYTLDNRGIRDKAAGFQLDGVKPIAMPEYDGDKGISGNFDEPGSWSDIRELTAFTYIASAALSLLRPHSSRKRAEEDRNKATDTWRNAPEWDWRTANIHRLIDIMLGQPVLIPKSIWDEAISAKLLKDNEADNAKKKPGTGKPDYFKKLKLTRNELLNYIFRDYETYSPITELSKSDEDADLYTAAPFRHLFSVLGFSQTSIDIEVRDGSAEWPTDSLIFGAMVLRVLFDNIAGIDTFGKTSQSWEESSRIYSRRLMIAGMANRNMGDKTRKIYLDKEKHTTKCGRDVFGAHSPLYKYASKHLKEDDRYQPVNYLRQFSNIVYGKGDTEASLSTKDIDKQTVQPENDIGYTNNDLPANERPNRYDYYRMILEFTEAILNDKEASLWNFCKRKFVGRVGDNEMRRLTILVLMILPSLIHEQLEYDYIRSKFNSEIVLNHSVMNYLIKKAEDIIIEASKKTTIPWQPH